MTSAIRVEKLSKEYRLGQRSAGYRTLRESIMAAVRAPWSRSRFVRRNVPSKNGSERQTFWALKDVSFQVKPGEVVGVIGRNGAGKSTLLKILSRVTEPTAGRVEFRGRMGSLLEVGTGFHPELTGRENVYLNGSILGMSRREIERKFDAIVAFAEMEQFLDTPVKRYSSGMYVRLAFAVATHLQPEILIFDEVLAVGDASYQRRCIDRMSQLAASGATILFVSHNMDLIPQLCTRAVLLQRGQVVRDGGARVVVGDYLNSLRTEECSGDLSEAQRRGDGRALFTRALLLDAAGGMVPRHRSGRDLRLRIEIDSTQDIKDVALAVIIQNLYGTRLITSWTRETGFPVNLVTGKNAFECRFHDVKLRPGHRVVIGLWMSTQALIDFVDHALVLDIDADEANGHLSADAAQGIVALDYEWSYASPATVDH